VSLKYLAIGRLVRDGTGAFAPDQHYIIADYLVTLHDPNGSAYGGQVMDIMIKGARKLKPDKRIRLTSENAYDLNVVADAFGGDDQTIIVHFAIADAEFGKQRSVATLLQEMKALLNGLDVSELNAPISLSVKDAIKAGLAEVANKYFTKEDLKGIIGLNINSAEEGVRNVDDTAKRREQRVARDAQRRKNRTCCLRFLVILLFLMAGGVGYAVYWYFFQNK